VAKLYSIGYIQETWLTSDTAPVICRGFLFVRYVVPRGPKGEKRPADVIGNAVKVMRIATGEIEGDIPDGGKDQLRRFRYSRPSQRRV
jgi:hypothetical protein